MTQNETTRSLIEHLTTQYGDDLVAVYGIGSGFKSSLRKTSDLDVIVILSDFDCLDHIVTVNLFETKQIKGNEVWLLYGTVEYYNDKKKFESISFADWAWAVRDLKYCSEHLWGADIRGDLPDPQFSYDGIVLRVAYHLEPTPEWKLQKSVESGKPTDEQMRFSKSIFKYGTLLLAMHYPDMNVFDKIGTLRELKGAVKDGRIKKLSLVFYEQALAFRDGTPFENFEGSRKTFMKLFVKETMNGLGVEWDQVKTVLQRGFGSPFQVIIDTVENNK